MSARLCLVAAVTACVLSAAALPLAAGRPSVGVIRWDAWNQVNGGYDAVSECVHAALSPGKWQFRLPFYAAALSPSNASFNADAQSVMDAEIAFAERAGIDYFLFDTYCRFGPNCSTASPYCRQYSAPGQTSEGYCPEEPAYGLSLFLNSGRATRLNFSLLLLGSPACDPDMQEEYLLSMQSARYHTVLQGRPLVFLFQFSDNEAAACAGGWNQSRAVFDAFRAKAAHAGLAEPYMVLMDFSVDVVVQHAAWLGFDAVSTYALPGGDEDGVPMAEQVRAAQDWWRQAADSGFPFIPIAPTGWDPRPRFEHPCPCVDEGPQHFLQATGSEVADLVVSALNFTCSHAAATEAETVVVYAWNESSENGAALIPSLGNKTMYLDALAQVLPFHCPAVSTRQAVSAAPD